MTSYAAPKCIKCKHLILAKGPLKCKAFPKGIPEEIVQDGYDHTKPYKGDNGIRFEPKKQK